MGQWNRGVSLNPNSVFPANYGYGNENYSTTAYGAQGGIDGGGFLGGTQGGSQTNPEGSKVCINLIRPINYGLLGR